jgi:60 kDa SS-A/Ro ribonucleoprotein
MDYTKHIVSKKKTSQSKKVPGVKKQKKNNAGGIAFKMDKWDYMSRFLILGTEGGTYYVGEKKLTEKATKNVQKCIESSGLKAVNMIVDISVSGRASNNDAAIYALALAASCPDDNTRKYALENLSKVCRIGTHLFHFMQFIKSLRGFGRGLREALAKWYTEKDIDALAYQMLKYKQRDGWAHADVLRLCHAKPISKQQDKMFAYAVGKRKTIPKVSDFAKGARKVSDRNKLMGISSLEKTALIIQKHKLTREVIPTELLNEVAIWEAMLHHMPINALVRNLGKMASMGMHDPFSDTLKITVDKLTDDIAIKRSRIHPIALLNAMLVYERGCGLYGTLSWTSNQKVVDALEYAFYKSFDNVEPTGKNIMLALDVSGSMITRMNNSVMSCRVASAVLAMVSMKTEPNTEMAGFTSDCGNSWESSQKFMHYSSSISMLPVSANDTLTAVVSKISGLGFGATDCALPFLYCQHRGIDVDAIVIYTDNETWAGDIHPWQALDKYEQHVGHAVKSVVVGMTSTNFTIASPDHSNMLDVVGFDTNTPAAISEFLR